MTGDASMIIQLLVALFLIIGASFALIGSIGLARFDDFYSRLHGPTKATTLGLGAILAASALYFSTIGSGISLHETLITVFLFLTAPIGAQLLGKAALHLRLPNVSGEPRPESVIPIDDSATASPHSELGK